MGSRAYFYERRSMFVKKLPLCLVVAMFSCTSMAGFMAINKSKIPSTDIYAKCNDQGSYRQATFNMNIPWKVMRDNAFHGRLSGVCGYYIKKHNKHHKCKYMFIGSGKYVLSSDLSMAKVTDQVSVPGYRIEVKPARYQFVKDMVVTIK